MTDLDIEVDPLLELFRAEVRTSLATLTRGRLDLEQAPDAIGPLANMAAAVRTIRGAARILGHTAVAELAARIDATLANAVSGRTKLTAADLDHLRRAEEVLSRLDHDEPGVWTGIYSEDIRELTEGRTLPLPLPSPPVVRASPPPPIVAVSAAAERSFVIDPSMLELFREEIRTHTAGLSEGLLELERDPANSQRIEPLMRAAHSLKGACRIVGIDSAVELAHLMEDGFVAAQTGALTIVPAAIDTLLRATDRLAGLGHEDPGNWAAAYHDDVSRLKAAVAAINRGETPPAPVADPVVVNVPSRVEIAAAVGSPPPAEAVVRVTAESLNRLMSLAGESLVQARWLQPFATALTGLKKLQDHITARLETLSQTAGTEAAAKAIAETVQLATRSRKLLADRISEFESHAGQAEDLNSRLYQEVIVSRMRPFADGLHGFPRLVRDTARMLGKQVRLDVVGQATEVDRDILEKLEAPLTHLLRNAIDHGIESAHARAACGKPAEGVLKLESGHRGGMLSITVSDDGAGIDIERLRKKILDRRLAPAEMVQRMTEAELLEFLFLPGFSTATQLTEVSGRGVGLDVVLETVRKVGGSVHITTALGRGTAFYLMLPLTLSVVRAVLVQIAGEPYAFPHTRIDRLLRVPRSEVQSLQHRQFITVGGQSVGLVLASQLLDLLLDTAVDAEIWVVLISDTSGLYGLIVDNFRGEQDLVVRPLDPRLGKVPNVSSAAILDDGSPVLIVDVEEMCRSMDQFIQTGTLRRVDESLRPEAAKKRVLVVDDSITVREVQKQILRARGYEVEVAVDGQDGWRRLQQERYDLVVSDVDMPRMNGLQLIGRIRENANLRDLPIIIVSYKDRDADRLLGLEAGANHYLTKASFHDDTFVQAVIAQIGEP